MLDLIMDRIALPWECGDRDCPYQWHLANYEHDEQGRIWVSEFNDGDWELHEGEMPSESEIDEAWIRYYRYVADTGDDVLGEISVQREIEKVQTWKALVKNTLGGVRVWRCKHGHRSVYPADAPEEVKAYLELRHVPGKGYYIESVEDLDDLRTLATVSRWGYITFTITIKRPRNEKTVTREIKREARRRLKLRETT